VFPNGNFRVNPSGRRPVTIRTRHGRIRVVRARRWRSTRAHSGLCITAAANERLALYCRSVARYSFDHDSIECTRIASSADRREVVFFEVLGDDRRSDDPS